MRSAYPALLAALLLAGCGTPPRQEPPAPVSSPYGTPPPVTRPAPGMEVRPYEPAAVPPSGQAQPVPNRAVQVLLRRADDQRREGDLNGAAASLERALRIAPRDPLLWHTLAQVREEQGKYGQAEEMAAKSNALAGPGHRDLTADNWRLIARVRRAVGDLAGARAAEARAR
jgi:Tfp pilus assembly protein PilF